MSPFDMISKYNTKCDKCREFNENFHVIIKKNPGTTQDTRIFLNTALWL